MKLFKPITTLLAITVTAAATSFEDGIPATSRLGHSLLTNARSLGNDDNYQGTWLAGYSIKFHSCATNDSFYENNEANNNNNNNNNNDAQFNGVYKQRLAHFQLCPSSTCGSSNSGCNDYVTDLSDFLYSYVQNKITMEEGACESVKENCYCENANDDDVSLQFVARRSYFAVDDCNVLSLTCLFIMFCLYTEVLVQLLHPSWTFVL
jgi:hypothetical protein